VPNRIVAAQVSDTTGVASSNEADKQKKLTNKVFQSI